MTDFIELALNSAGAGRENQPQAPGLALAELDWPSAVIGLSRIAAPDKSAESSRWDIRG
jgi:hypothetical protein